MANVVLIGATGFVGSAVLNELLSRGHKVTAVVRNATKLPKNDNLTAVEEDVANVDALANIAKGKDAVISAYNPGWGNPDIKRLTEENYPKIVEAVKKSGVGRLLIVGGAGTLFVKPGLRVVDSGAIPAEIMDAVSSLGDFYLNYLTKEHDLDWVFFSPAGALRPPALDDGLQHADVVAHRDDRADAGGPERLSAIAHLRDARLGGVGRLFARRLRQLRLRLRPARHAPQAR